MNKLLLLTALIFLGCFNVIAQKEYQVKSPDSGLNLKVSLTDKINFLVEKEGREIINSDISMTLSDGKVLGANPKVSKVSRQSINSEIASPFYKKDVVKDIFNEMTLSFKGNFAVVFRVYDDGVAYRFTTRMRDSIVIANEQALYNFPEDFKTYAAYVNNKKSTFEEQFFNSFEQPYVNETITALNDKRLKILPLLVDMGDGSKICITEADLEDYPGMFLNNDASSPKLSGVFAPYPKVKEQGGHNMLQMLVKEREDYIAKTAGTRSFPWRTFIISSDDKQLANCDMVYRLASPSRVADFSWIKPGKVAWEWWNDWNIYGVDFRAGINNPTYKYYIDFAAENGIEYVILDEGWAVNLKADMLQVIPGIDLKELVEYGESKGVGIILWAGYWAFARDMENVVKHYSEMGVKGFKIDFLDRDDQDMVNFLYEASEVCAKYRMLVDFHGVFKPTGLQRTYPNVLNYEGVNGLEQMKWSSEGDFDMVKYDVEIPFIRMIAGPMDYTQGAMRNASRGNHRSINSEPMSQGTRCRQLATYVVFESPFNMLCDAPTNYRNEQECTDFIASVPTVWDETVAIAGKVSEYVAIARRSGDDWYIGALTNWSPRELELDLSFLGDGDYELVLFKDGVNADRAACDYKREVVKVPANRKIKISMAPGGGWVAHLKHL